MYKDKINDILLDLENKEIDIAGGAVVGMVLSITNSLIKYISNLTIGKKKYIDVQEEIKSILFDAEELKQNTLKIIDRDKEILEEILSAYKLRKENMENYNNVNKKAVEFCMQVVEMAFETLKLTERISKVGNKMLASDFKVCASYSFASVESAIVNVNINLDSVNSDIYKHEVKNKCDIILKEAEKIKVNIYRGEI